MYRHSRLIRISLSRVLVFLSLMAGNLLSDGECTIPVDSVSDCGRLFVTPYEASIGSVWAVHQTGMLSTSFLSGRVEMVGGTTTFDVDGNFLYPQWEHDNVIVLSPVGEVVRTITGGGLNGPRCVAFTCDGEIAVCSYLTDSIKFYDSDGTYLRNHGSNISDPLAIAFDRRGFMYVGNRSNGNGFIAVFDADRNFVFSFGQGLVRPHPFDLAFDSNEDLFVTIPGWILKFTRDGKPLISFGHVDLDPVGLAIDETDLLYVTSVAAPEIFVFTAHGQLVDRFEMETDDQSNVVLGGIEIEPVRTDDCDGNGLADSCDIADSRSSDCQFNGIPDECELAANDQNANRIPDDCEPDCNNNGVPDDLDLAGKGSEDCNGNLIPDECEPDCNENGNPDGCDILSGQSVDCDLNDVPDECDIAASGPFEAPEGALLNARNGHYYVLTDAQTWLDAEDYAVTVGGHLATVRNAEENQWIRDTFRPLTSSGSVWIGFNDQDDEGHFRWSSGEPVTYTNWASGEPNDNGGQEDFTELLLYDSLGRWNDYFLGSTRPGVVEVVLTIDCNTNGLIDQCEIEEGAATDCNSNGRPDDCEFAGTVDCNGNGVVDLCDQGGNRDCNRNGVSDWCDIADGSTDDCNANNVPDSCDLGSFSQALRFDGVDDVVRIPRSAALEPESLTIELWAKFDGLQSRNTRLVRKGGISGGYILAADQQGDRKVQMRLQSPPLSTKDFRQHDEYDQEWHHFAGAYDDGQVSLFIDGQLVSITHHDGFAFVQDPLSDLFIGHGAPSSDPSEHFKGLISDVRLWNYVRSEDEIASSMNSRLTGLESGLVAYWPLSEGQGQVVSDLGPLGNTGSLGMSDELPGATDDPSWISVSDLDLTANDCNGNGVVDDCEIASGITSDCNQNGVPDECEPDDDKDGVPNECDRFGDFDADTDIDLDDYASLQACMLASGPGENSIAVECSEAFDSDLDSDVDLADFAEFARRFDP